MLHSVEVPTLDPVRLGALVGSERADHFAGAAARARAVLDGRPFLNVNSTAIGGGVAELLQTLVGYARGVGVDAQWLVIPAARDHAIQRPVQPEERATEPEHGARAT